MPKKNKTESAAPLPPASIVVTGVPGPGGAASVLNGVYLLEGQENGRARWKRRWRYSDAEGEGIDLFVFFGGSAWCVGNLEDTPWVESSNTNPWGHPLGLSWVVAGCSGTDVAVVAGQYGTDVRDESSEGGGMSGKEGKADEAVRAARVAVPVDVLERELDSLTADVTALFEGERGSTRIRIVGASRTFVQFEFRRTPWKTLSCRISLPAAAAGYPTLGAAVVEVKSASPLIGPGVVRKLSALCEAEVETRRAAGEGQIMPVVRILHTFLDTNRLVLVVREMKQAQKQMAGGGGGGGGGGGSGGSGGGRKHPPSPAAERPPAGAGPGGAVRARGGGGRNHGRYNSYFRGDKAHILSDAPIVCRPLTW